MWGQENYINLSVSSFVKTESAVGVETRTCLSTFVIVTGVKTKMNELNEYFVCFFSLVQKIEYT